MIISSLMSPDTGLNLQLTLASQERSVISRQRSGGALAMVLKMKKQPLYTAISSSLLLSTTATFAQQLPSQAMETIIVTGARTPIPLTQLAGTVTIIDNQQIVSSQAFSITDLLRSQAGINISQSGSIGSLTEVRMRGGESNHVLVLIDGVEINDLGQSDAANFAHISLENVQRIEILKGPQSALWGSGAIGGVINIITQQGAKATKALIRAELGEANSRRLAFNLNGRTKELRYGFAASHFNTDGQNISRTGTEKDGYKNNQVSTSGQWQVNNTNNLEFNLRYLSARNEFDDYVPADADNYTDVSQNSGKLVWHHRPQSGIWQQQLGLQFSHNRNQSYTNQQFTSGSNSDKQRVFWQNHFAYQKNSHVNLVAEHTQEDFQQSGQASYFGDPNQSQENTVNSIVADLLHQFNRDISVISSLRYDNNDIYNNASSYNLGLNYHFNDQLKLYSSYAKGVKNPTYVETFGFFPLAFNGNKDLQPETSKNWEIGAEYSLSPQWLINLSYFNSKLTDEIVTVYSADYSTSSSINSTGKSKRQGAEFNLKGNLGSTQINFSYAYLDASQPDAEGLQHPEARRARHTAGMTANYHFADDLANAYVQVSYQGEQQDTNFNAYPAEPVSLGSYLLINTAASYKINPNLTATVRAENLLDKGFEDVFGFVGQSRRVYMGVSYSL